MSGSDKTTKSRRRPLRTTKIIAADCANDFSRPEHNALRCRSLRDIIAVEGSRDCGRSDQDYDP
jgi:hypothetical protein